MHFQVHPSPWGIIGCDDFPIFESLFTTGYNDIKNFHFHATHGRGLVWMIN